MTRDVDIKTQVLLAVYAEYQEDIPNMDNVSFDALGMDSTAFRAALIKLQNEGLISGLIIQPPNETRADRVRGLIKTHMLPTREGLEEAERFIRTGETSTARQRLRDVVEFAGKIGLELVKAYAEKLIK